MTILKNHKFNNKLPSLFYFDTSGDYPNGRFYEQSMLGRFSDWMFFKGNYPPGSCNLPVVINDNLQLLKDKFVEKDGERGFSYRDYCGRPIFYKLQEFYAFKLKNREHINIKEEILEKLKTSSE